jgi:hypothetical protein
MVKPKGCSRAVLNKEVSTMNTKPSRIALLAALTGIAWLSTAAAEDITSGQRYVVDLAVSGMPINLTFDQLALVAAQLPAFEDVTTPGQVYLDTIAHTGWQPEGGDARSAPVADAFVTPGAGYLNALDIAGWQPPGSGYTMDMATPGERYLDMLADAGWEPAGLEQVMLGMGPVLGSSLLVQR